MGGRRVLFVSAGAAAPPGWTDALGTLRVVSGAEVRGALADGGADVALVEATAADPLAPVRELRAADPALQPVLLASGAARTQVERALLFAPGVGETWVREAVDEVVLEEATSITRQRRSYQQLQRQLAGMSTQKDGAAARPLVSDAYLSALLQVLPDPAIALDAGGRVVYWSDAAERMLGVSSGAAAGRAIAELIPAAYDWQTLMARTAHAAGREELRLPLGGDSEERTVVVSMAPVLLPNEAGRAVLLHDITAERRAQAQLEAQAHELEQQASEMEQQAAELEAQTAELHEIAAEREHLLAEREQTLAELRRALELRTRFYASMNHEIRTPINAILGYADLLESGAYGTLTDEQLAALGKSQRAARHLVEIVNDLLDLSKLEAGRMDLQPELVHLPELIEELMATTEPLAAEHGSELRIEADCARPVVTDARRVRQILLNLISNAAKFGEGKPITIRCVAARSSGVAVEVEDRGIGIAAADLPVIFEEFVQVGGGTRGGTGLGLPISRRLAGLLGGELTARSVVGQGSVFRLDLPAVLPGEADGSGG